MKMKNQFFQTKGLLVSAMIRIKFTFLFSMTVLSMTLLSTFGSTIAQAKPHRAPADDLRTLMQAMSTKYELLVKQVANTAPAAPPLSQSASVAQELDHLIQQTLDFTPEPVTELPAKQQPAELAVYQQMLKDLDAADLTLVTALTNNDRDAANTALKKMADLRTRGHQRFAD
jgi:hypothetical protein